MAQARDEGPDIHHTHCQAHKRPSLYVQPLQHKFGYLAISEETGYSHT